jgi:hypothetical protein
MLSKTRRAHFPFREKFASARRYFIADNMIFLRKQRRQTQRLSQNKISGFFSRGKPNNRVTRLFAA